MHLPLFPELLPLARLTRQKTFKTFCGARVKAEYVTDDMSAVTCMACRARVAERDAFAEQCRVELERLRAGEN